MILIVAALLASQAPARPPACISTGATNVSLDGTIGVATAAGDPPNGEPAYRYATLTLDHPICLGDPATGSGIRIVALVARAPNQTLPFRYKGDHVRVTAERIERTGPGAPTRARLLAPTISADE
jgi:hypothetical protein